MEPHIGPTISTLTLLLSCLAWGAANAQNARDDCYRIDGAIIAGIVIGDVAITIMIAIAIYFFARRGAKTSDSGHSLPVPMNEKSKKDTEMTESPYEELRGPDRGLYSELRTGRK
uniref:TYRO protein tyrosine kinase-binding protein-like n=1 Tax=Pristiophorus japonicus TaxID=55135 RepID=UPI00398F8BD9